MCLNEVDLFVRLKRRTKRFTYARPPACFLLGVFGVYHFSAELACWMNQSADLTRRFFRSERAAHDQTRHPSRAGPVWTDAFICKQIDPAGQFWQMVSALRFSLLGPWFSFPIWKSFARQRLRYSACVQRVYCTSKCCGQEFFRLSPKMILIVYMGKIVRSVLLSVQVLT